MQKSQKGRLTAGQQEEEIPRRAGVRREGHSSQQFGGVGHRGDGDVRHLSGRARQAITLRVSRTKGA